MWIAFAFASAFFAGVTAILAKCGIKKTDSDVATAIRTIVVLIFSWLMVWIVGAQSEIRSIDGKSWLFLILSGLATGASWLCYFKALQLGDVNKVTPIDKSSTVLTMILAIIFLHEEFNAIKLISILLIAFGTYMMIQKKKTEEDKKQNKLWFIYAIFSAIFASITSILSKVGMQTIHSNLGTAIRTVVVLLMAWMIVFIRGKQHTIADIDGKSWLFLILSGMATGASWLCYYRALKLGPASLVVSIDKLSIVVTIAFSYIFLGEKLTKKAALGLVLVVAGTLLMLV